MKSTIRKGWDLYLAIGLSVGVDSGEGLGVTVEASLGHGSIDGEINSSLTLKNYYKKYWITLI